MKSPLPHFTCLTLTSALLLSACGGSPSGHSALGRDTPLAATTPTSQAQICDAYVDYLVSAIGSADAYCLLTAQGRASGTTDAELQSTCATEEAVCRASKEQNFSYFRATAELSCWGGDPLSSAQYSAYEDCPITVGALEDCGIERVDTLMALKDVACSELTVALRASLGSAPSGPACNAIACQ